MTHLPPLPALPATDEDGRFDSTADTTVRECETCGEYERPDYGEQGCPSCGRIGSEL